MGQAGLGEGFFDGAEVVGGAVGAIHEIEEGENFHEDSIRHTLKYGEYIKALSKDVNGAYRVRGKRI